MRNLLTRRTVSAHNGDMTGNEHITQTKAGLCADHGLMSIRSMDGAIIHEKGWEPCQLAPESFTHRKGTLTTKLNSEHHGQSYTGIICRIDSRGGTVPFDTATAFWGWQIDTGHRSTLGLPLVPVQVFRHDVLRVEA